MDYSREKIPQPHPSLCTFCFVSHRFPLTTIHTGIRRLLHPSQLVTGFEPTRDLERSATRRQFPCAFILYLRCLSKTSLAAGRGSQEAAGALDVSMVFQMRSRGDLEGAQSKSPQCGSLLPLHSSLISWIFIPSAVMLCNSSSNNHVLNARGRGT